MRALYIAYLLALIGCAAPDPIQVTPERDHRCVRALANAGVVIREVVAQEELTALVNESLTELGFEREHDEIWTRPGESCFVRVERPDDNFVVVALYFDRARVEDGRALATPLKAILERHANQFGLDEALTVAEEITMQE
jgi:hypothetical protein